MHALFSLSLSLIRQIGAVLHNSIDPISLYTCMYIYTNVYMQTYVVQVNRYKIQYYNNYIRLAAALRCKDSTLFYRYKLYLSQRNITVVLYLQKYISYIYVNIENLSILRYIALHCFTLLCIALYCLSAIYRYIYSFFWFMFF